MKLKKRIFSIVLCLSLTLGLVTNVFASNDHIGLGNLEEITNPISSEFSVPELTSAELENICAYVNGDSYIHDSLIEDIQHCGTEAMLWINHYYSKQSKQKSVPTYLSEAYQKVNRTNDAELMSYSNTTSYVDSQSGKFRIFYNEAPQSANIVAMANLVATIYDSLDYYLCDYYGFNRPTTNGSQYHVSIVESIPNAAANTPYIATNRSRINLVYSYIEEFYNNANNAYILGVAIHEYMHAILFSYGIMFAEPEDVWFHESLARAVGIEYEVTYANRSNICGNISAFIGSLQYSLGSLTTTNFKYGGAVFHIFLFEDYDEWFTIVDVLENHNPNISLMSNLNNYLVSEYNSNLSSAYIHFLYCCTNPDTILDLSPSNRLSTGANSWGKPTSVATYTVGTSLTSYSGSGSLPYLAAHFIKITPNNYSNKTVSITVNYSSISGNAIPKGAYSLHQISSGTYTYSDGAILDNKYTDWCVVHRQSNGELYFIIANAGISGELDYSYTITISN